MVLKAQQEPQLPWFFTGVTAPLATQSTLLGTVAFAYLNGLPAGLSLQRHTGRVSTDLAFACFSQLASERT